MLQIETLSQKNKNKVYMKNTLDLKLFSFKLQSKDSFKIYETFLVFIIHFAKVDCPKSVTGSSIVNIIATYVS
jgi:hypothetical protein